MLVEVHPLAVLAHEVGAVALPQHVAVLLPLGGQAGVDDARGDEGAAGALAVGGHLDDVGDQRVDGGLHQGAGVLAADLGVLLEHLQPVLHGHLIILGDGAVPDLIEAAHAAEGVGPGAVVGPGPDVVPLAGGVRPAVIIGVARLDILHLLAGGGVGNALMQRKLAHL